MQGFNMGRYYPPDAANAPAFNTTSHPLGKRASKISKGILTVRFELPFAVWCNHCTPPAIIGQGVRFNAEKKKVGNYHSTPIWSFRMKHSACGGWWEIRTDPAKSEYVVVDGARRREYGSTEGGDEAQGELKFLTEEERERRREDAFARLEGKVEDKGVERGNRERVEELYDKAEVWRDPYDVNARLRSDFRAKRKVWKKEERHKEGMQEKFSLGFEIADETDADRTRAQFIDFGGSAEEKREDTTWKPLFVERSVEKSTEPLAKGRKLKSEIAAEKSRQSLQQTLIGNTKAVIDPFLSHDTASTPKPNFGIRKRKRETQVDEQSETPIADTKSATVPVPSTTPTMKPSPLPALVGYDSD